MTNNYQRQGSGWGAKIAWTLALLIAGAALAIYALANWQGGARFFGVAPKAEPQEQLLTPPSATPARSTSTSLGAEPLGAADAARISALESRLAAIEGQAQQAAGSAGRADALLIAFAARRAIDRGVALGYLEPLLIQRFGQRHQGAVATVITASRDPVRLEQLVEEYENLDATLRGRGSEEGWWDASKRQLGSLITIRHADVPSPRPQARYDRALAHLDAGEVDAALAETMRLPGASSAKGWIDRARRYIAAHRALDELESAALLGGGQTSVQSAP